MCNICGCYSIPSGSVWGLDNLHRMVMDDTPKLNFGWVECEYCAIRNLNDDKTLYCVKCGAPLPIVEHQPLRQTSETPNLRDILDKSMRDKL